jgi:hypothetical protein
MIKMRSIESGQPKRCANNVESLKERERRRDIGDGPLHQFALLQTLQEFVHGIAPTLKTFRRFRSAKKLLGFMRNWITGDFELLSAPSWPEWLERQ